MATNNKVFVSPGVYTSEVDLSFVAQSVGVTTLGIVGETQKGPAFEPIFIRNFDEFTSYFGGTSPEKFINTQIPKYEASYIAKAYLQQSNQLFVTRVLGLSGYDAGPSWSITTKANVDPTTVNFDCTSGVTTACIFNCTDFNVIDYSIDFTGCTDSISSISFITPGQIPAQISDKINLPYENFNGSTSTLYQDMTSQIFDILNATNPLSAKQQISIIMDLFLEMYIVHYQQFLRQKQMFLMFKTLTKVCLIIRHLRMTLGITHYLII